MLKKLRIKFVCINMTLVTIMLVIILCMVVRFTDQNIEQDSIKRLEAIAANPIYMFGPGEKPGISTPYFTVELNNKGELVESHSGFYDLSDRTLLKEVINGSQKITDRTGVLSDYQLRFLRVSTPTGQFLIFADISGEISTLTSLAKNCFFIGVVSFLAFLLISIYLANWAVEPVDTAWKQQKQFIADASHELKTPLTVILTNAELLQSHYTLNASEMPNSKDMVQTTADAPVTTSSVADSVCTRRFTENILLMAGQMRNLVEGLLELSRIDNQSMKSIMEPLNLSELAENSLCQFEPLYYEAGFECNPVITTDLKVKGSSSHLKQVIDILLDNSLKYADKNSEIKIQLEKQKNHAVFSVSTQGDAISSEDLKNIFKRFYRVDKSRQGSESYGLGLSIAESIVREHCGKIWAESQNGQNTFFVRLNLIQ